ncbi:MAG: hypothetical protein AVDCRST_MAG85-4083, partial [uncultured Solirubrobacteraceae bacterium]
DARARAALPRRCRARVRRPGHERRGGPADALAGAQAVCGRRAAGVGRRRQRRAAAGARGGAGPARGRARRGGRSAAARRRRARADPAAGAARLRAAPRHPAAGPRVRVLLVRPRRCAADLLRAADRQRPPAARRARRRGDGRHLRRLRDGVDRAPRHARARSRAREDGGAQGDQRRDRRRRGVPRSADPDGRRDARGRARDPAHGAGREPRGLGRRMEAQPARHARAARGSGAVRACRGCVV